MRLSRGRQTALQQRARRLGSVVPRCTELVGGYAGGVAVFVREPLPLWAVVMGAAGGFVIVLSYLVVLLRGSARRPEAGVGEWSRALLDHIPGWRRVDDVALAGYDIDHVISTPAGLVVVVAKWRVAMSDVQARRRRHERDLAYTAAAARRVRRLTSLPPNALDVPVHAALLLWGPGNGAVATGWNAATGVYVLAATEPHRWPAELTSPQPYPLGRPADVDEALRKVRGWAEYHRRRVSARRLVLILLGEVRRGMADRRHAKPAIRA
jgi:hypothetical protein